MRPNSICVFLVAVAAQISYLDRQTFQGINAAQCFRLLSAKGAVGCSAYSQQVGAESMELVQIKDQQNLDQFINSGKKATLFLPYSLFTASNVDRLSGRLGGLILLQGEPAKFDDQDKIPNLEFGLYSNDSNPHNWNPSGSQGLFTNFEFPIYEIQGFTENSTLALQEALEFNTNNPNAATRYGVEFRGKMESSSQTNAKTCLQRGFCDPVGEKSLWSTFDADLNGEKPFILVSSKLDSNSLFRERSSGHSHRLSNIVLLGLISAMSNGNMANLPKNIVFGMFGAESFGFAGSQRFVEDLTGFTCQKKDLHENCPLNVGKGCSSPCHRDLDFTKLDFNKIEAIIEYDTVGHLYNAGDYFLHADDTAQSSTLMSDFGVEFEAPVYNQTSQRTVKVLPAVQGIKLPPSSAMSFLKRKRNLPTIVVSDYNSEFQNKNYRTSMDNKIPDSTIVSELCGLINSHAKILYNMAGGTTDLEKIQISCDLVAQMIACATESFQTCPLLKKYYPDATFAVQDKLYPSVFSFTPQLRTYPFFLLTMMKVGTGIVSKDCKTDSECDAGFECLGTKCTKSMTRQHNAYGTGLSFDLDSGKFSQSDETKGTWVESRWDSQGMRIFKMQSWAQDLIPFGIGLILTFLSLLIFCKFDVLNWFESMEKKSQ